MLRNGSRGDEVMALQKSLSAMGFDAGTADGIFGPKTEAAVKACQEKCGVTADGIWGPASQAAFDKLQAAAKPGIQDMLESGKEEAKGGIQDMLEAGREAAADVKPDTPNVQ